MVDRTSRPIVPDSHPDEREHRRLLAVRASASMPKDGTEAMAAPLKMQQLTAALLPAAAQWEGSTVYHSDDAAPAFSDGVNWNTLATADSVSTVASDLATLDTTVDTLLKSVRCTTQLDKTSNVTPTDIPGLSVTLASGSKWAFRAHLSTISGVTGGLGVTFGGTATATSWLRNTWWYNNGALSDTDMSETTKGTTQTRGDALVAVVIEGTIDVNAGGTLTIQGSQAVSNGTTSSFKVNSTFTLTPLAN